MAPVDVEQNFGSEKMILETNYLKTINGVSSQAARYAWMCMVRNWMGDLPDECPKKVTPPSFGTLN